MIDRVMFLVAVLGVLISLNGKTIAEEASTGSEMKFAPGALGMAVPVITSAKDRDKYVGRLVAVRGIVSESKLAFIVGVEVKATDELRGREAYAVGILGRFTATDDEARTANDGPGVKYTLYSDLSGKLADARSLPR